MTSSHTTTEDAVPELRLSCSFYLAVWAYTCICMCIYYRTSLDEEGREIMLNRLILICKNHPARFWPMLFCRSGQESPGPLLANAFLPIRTGRESDPARLVGRNGSYVIHEAENSSDGFSPHITLRGG